MAFEDTGLDTEATAIMTQPGRPPQPMLEVRFKTVVGELSPLKVLSLSIERRYHDNYGDQLILEVVMGVGSVQHYLYPQRNRLEVTVIKRYTGQDGGDIGLNGSTRHYDGFLLDDQSNAISGDSEGVQSATQGDIRDIQKVRLQLMDKALGRVRTTQVGGNYRNVTPGVVVRQLLTQVCQQLNQDQDNQVYGVDMVAPDNTTPRQHICIAHGTPLVEVPDLLQSREGGIYSTGLGFYLQDQIWYLYPEFNLKRLNTTPKTLTIINVPSRRYTDIERTYRQGVHQTVILATGEVSFTDSSLRAQTNQGNGTRFTDASQVMNGFGDVQGNRLRVARSRLNNEYTASSNHGRQDYAPVSRERIASNSFEQASRLAAQQGGVLTLEWQNSNPDLLYPGQPLQFLYHDQDNVITLKGILLGNDNYYHDPTQGPVSQGYLCHSALLIYVDPTPTA